MPYGRAFFTMLEGLGVVEEPKGSAPPAGGDDVRLRPLEAGPRSHAAFGPVADAPR